MIINDNVNTIGFASCRERGTGRKRERETERGKGGEGREREREREVGKRGRGQREKVGRERDETYITNSCDYLPL